MKTRNDRMLAITKMLRIKDYSKAVQRKKSSSESVKKPPELRSKLGQPNSGIDPEVMQAGITLAGYHIESGAQSFTAYSKAMVDDLGDMIKPYLRGWYEGIRYNPELPDESKAGMTSAADIDAGKIEDAEPEVTAT